MVLDPNYYAYYITYKRIKAFVYTAAQISSICAT